MAFKVVNKTVIDNNTDGDVNLVRVENVPVLVGDGNGNITLQNVILNIDSDSVSEGSNNLYFTDARAQAAVAADIAAAVAAEETRALAAELVLTNNLAAEVTRATGAEGTLTTNLATEVSDRTAADTALDTAYKAADSNLQGQIDNIVANTEEAAIDSLREIVTAIKSADVAVPGFRRKIPLKFGDEAERKRLNAQNESAEEEKKKAEAKTKVVRKTKQESQKKIPQNLKKDKKTFKDSSKDCLLYTSPSPRDRHKSRMPSSA